MAKFNYQVNSADRSQKHGCAWISECHREWSPGDNDASTFLPWPLRSSPGKYTLESGGVYFVHEPWKCADGTIDYRRFHLYVSENGPEEISFEEANDILRRRNAPRYNDAEIEGW